MGKTIAFFGHRTIFYQKDVEEKLFNLLKDKINNGYTKVIMGARGDFDSISLQVCTKIKNTFYKDLEIIVVFTNLSCLTKKTFESNSIIDLYHKDKLITMYYEIENYHYKRRITISNQKSIDNSDLVICYVEKNCYRSGAKTAMKYALKTNKEVINLCEK